MLKAIKRAAAVKTLFVLLRFLADHFPFTVQGFMVLAAAVLALQVLGYGNMDLVVFALAVCGLTIVGFCLLSVLSVGLYTQFRLRDPQSPLQRKGQPVSVEAGFPNETALSLPAMGWVPLVRVSWKVVYPDAISTRIRLSPTDGQLNEEIIPQKRCLACSVTRRFTISDVLGLCRYSWRQSQEIELMALPRINSIKALPLLRSLTAEDGIPNPQGNPDGDRMEIRRYVAGDSVRDIMWKVYARNRQLNVRLAEKSVFHSNRTLAYLLSGPNDEAAAAVARIAVERGALGDNWLFGADGTAEPCNTVAEALRAIAASRALDEPLGYGLDNFLRQAASQGESHCIVIAGAGPGPWVTSLKQTVGRFRGPFTVVLATDGFASEETPALWQRLLYRGEKDNGAESRKNDGINDSEIAQGPRPSLRSLGGLLTDIGQLVESTLVVDRNTGLSFDRNLKRV
ncbi:MAG: DUF58 domain-containing protein [Pseudohongiellaceae bacterium]